MPTTSVTKDQIRNVRRFRPYNLYDLQHLRRIRRWLDSKSARFDFYSVRFGVRSCPKCFLGYLAFKYQLDSLGHAAQLLGYEDATDFYKAIDTSCFNFATGTRKALAKRRLDALIKRVAKILKEEAKS